MRTDPGYIGMLQVHQEMLDLLDACLVHPGRELHEPGFDLSESCRPEGNAARHEERRSEGTGQQEPGGPDDE